ncbi:HAD family hydrolase [bacterium]|nr:HAD family hydrolase [bacterium]
MKEYTTLLLDLDGTLLDIEVSFFFGPMVEAMHQCFRDILDMDRFRKGLFGGTEAIMVEPRSDGETNLEGFNRTFSNCTGMDIPDIEQRFRQFYSDVFPTLSRYGKPSPGASQFIARAEAEGYTLCLATNPIFPTLAILERLRWSGVDPDAFSFVPGLETMSTCKPRIDYYLELCSILHLDPSECLMVGNDMEQDLPASETGMGTFLVEGHVVSRGKTDLVPDARGSLEDLGRLLGFGK